MIPFDIQHLELTARRNFIFQILYSQPWPAEIKLQMEQKLQSIDKQIEDLNTLELARRGFDIDLCIY